MLPDVTSRGLGWGIPCLMSGEGSGLGDPMLGVGSARAEVRGTHVSCLGGGGLWCGLMHHG